MTSTPFNNDSEHQPHADQTEATLPDTEAALSHNTANNDLSQLKIEELLTALSDSKALVILPRA